MSAQPSDPPHFGLLLARLTRVVRDDLLARLAAAGLPGARVAHTQVITQIEADGSRLSALAAGAGMTLPAMTELVDDLERLGIVERCPDPDDRRAKLICLTDAGREAVRVTDRTIGEVEAEYARRIGPNRFEAATRTLDDLLRSLDPGAR